jgi:pyruvate dehydrogenase E2 component (dihydrolipoamide acetyltransferase)
VSEGAILLTLRDRDARMPAPAQPGSKPTDAVIGAAPRPLRRRRPRTIRRAAIRRGAAFALAYAGPGVRKLARELAVDLGKVERAPATRERVHREDVESAAKGRRWHPRPAPAAATGGRGSASTSCRAEDRLHEVGEVEAKPLSRIKKISGATFIATG